MQIIHTFFQIFQNSFSVFSYSSVDNIQNKFEFQIQSYTIRLVTLDNYDSIHNHRIVYEKQIYVIEIKSLWY